MEMDAGLSGEFAVEAREHLENAEQLLVGIETKAGKERQDDIDSLFRAIHSMKGAAGVLGYTHVSKLAHAMESLLSKVRSSEIQLVRDHINMLLEGVDRLNSMADDLSNSGEVECGDTLQKLEKATMAAPSAQKAAAKHGNSKAEPFLPPCFSITPERKARISSALGCYYEIQIKLPTDKLQPVLAELESFGQIIESQQEQEVCRILYATILDHDLIDEAVKTESRRIIQIKEAVGKPPLLTEAGRGIQGNDAIAAAARAASAAIPASLSQTQELRRNGNETVRINVEVIDRLMALASELVLVRNQQIQWYDKNDPVGAEITQRFNAVTSELQSSIMNIRMQPIGNVFSKLPRIARDLSLKLRKRMELETHGSEVEVDKAIIESLADPLNHIIRNCCDHGIEDPDVRQRAGKPETGRIVVEAMHEGGQILVRITDDGRGMDVEKIKAKALERKLKTAEELKAMSNRQALNLIMLPGFSTAATVSDISGRGVGMDVVRTSVEKLGGSIDISSTLGRGSSITLSLPLTLAIMSSLLVKAGKSRVAIPQANLEEVVCLFDDEIGKRLETLNNQEVFRYHGNILQLVRLDELLSSPEPFDDARRQQIAVRHAAEAAKPSDGTLKAMNIAIVKSGAKRYGLIVEKVLGPEEIVVKPMHPSMKSLKCFLGATVLGDGKVSLILDIDGIGRHALGQVHGSSAQKAEDEVHIARSDDAQRVLLFKSGAKEQFAISLALIKRVDWIKTSSIEFIGDREFITIDGSPVRILRLDKVLEVSPCEMKEEMFLILPKHIKRPFGILASEFSEICDTVTGFSHNGGFIEDGLLGTAEVKGRLTIFPDLYRIIEKAEPKWFAADGTKRDPSSNAKIKVLLAEDTPFFRQLVKRYLESDNYKVDTSANGREALDKLSTSKYDLLLSDLEMPLMNGWQLAEAVRSSPKLKSLPMVALTSLDSEPDRQAALKSGFNDYIVKIEREKFLSQIAKFISAHPSGRQP